MAYAQAEVEEVVTRTTTTTAIVLRLTPDEADFLHDVMGRVGGSMESRRRHQAAISDALQSAGVDHSYTKARDITGIIQVEG